MIDQSKSNNTLFEHLSIVRNFYGYITYDGQINQFNQLRNEIRL